MKRKKKIVITSDEEVYMHMHTALGADQFRVYLNMAKFAIIVLKLFEREKKEPQ